ncbi:MAG: hypothetical protein ACPG46_10890 [Thalassotalea sp.]
MQIKLLVIFLMTAFVSIDIRANDKLSSLTCEDFNWSDVVTLVEPYLDETLYVALVMQGQSSDYKTSIAASMVIDNSFPINIQKILEFIVKSDC